CRRSGRDRGDAGAEGCAPPELGRIGAARVRLGEMPRKQGDAVDGLVLDAAERIAADDCAPADVDGVDRERLLASDQPEPRLDPEETTNVRRVAGDRDRLQPGERL